MGLCENEEPGSHMCFTVGDGKMETRSFVGNFENVIGKIYSYFSRSTIRQRKLKEWHNFLDMPEIKFKRLFEIRWSSIRNCLKPILINVTPGKTLPDHSAACL